MNKLFQNFKRFKSRKAIFTTEGEIVYYGDFLKYAELLKKKILSRNIILLITENSCSSILSYVATYLSENSIILVDRNLDKSFISKIIKSYEPNYIISPQNYTINETTKKILFINNFVVKKTAFKKKKVNLLNKLILTTSGTTHSPKFVRLSHLNLFSNVKNIIKSLNIKADHVTITTLPMSYSYGLSIINSHLESGSKILVNNFSVLEKKFWHNIKKLKITSFGGVPEMYKILLKIKFYKNDLSSIRYLTQAGGKLDEKYLDEIKKIFLKLKKKFIIMYGQTEASPRMTYLKWEDFKLKTNSIGKPFQNCKIILRNKKLKNNSNGEIIYKGKNVCLGYAKNYKDLFKGNLNNYVLKTGDLGFKDKKNFYYLTGRKKKIIKLFGVRMSVLDINNFLNKNKINAYCKLKDEKINIVLKKKYKNEKIIDLLSKHLKINKNFIICTTQKQNLIYK